jgi:hypothetical protein
VGSCPSSGSGRTIAGATRVGRPGFPSGTLWDMEKRYYPAMPPIPRGSVPTRRAWHALDELLELLGLSGPLHERLEKQFSAEGVEEVQYLIRLIHLTVNTGRSQELGRALVGILSKDSMQMKRAEVVSWIRTCATSHKEGGGDSSAATALVTYLCRCDPAFEALRADLAFLGLWLGRIYGKNARGLPPSPEYCAAVFSIKTGAFGDRPSGRRSLEDDYRFKRKEYVDAVASDILTRSALLRNFCGARAVASSREG